MGLIAQLEAAREASSELDEAIAFALGWTAEDDPDLYAHHIGPMPRYWTDPNGYGAGHGGPPAFTRSYDAAISLLPENKDWGIMRVSPDTASRKSLLYEAEFYPRDFWHDKDRIIVEAPTGPLAICLVACKARGID